MRVEEARLRPEGGVLTVVLDRTVVEEARRQRMIDATLRWGDGRVDVRVEGRGEALRFSDAFRCARCDISYNDPTPALFSFNNPVGACEACKGFGRTMEIDPDLASSPTPGSPSRRGASSPFRPPSTATASRTCCVS